MSFSADLLAQARGLATRERKRPRQASLRRAVSTAYYGLFHFLIQEASGFLVGTVPRRAAHRRALARAFDHAQMRRASRDFEAGRPGPWLRAAGEVPSGLREVASGFAELQRLRHLADYDPSTTWSRAIAMSAVGRAERAVRAWNAVRGTPAADAFLLALLVKSRA